MGIQVLVVPLGFLAIVVLMDAVLKTKLKLKV